MTDPLIHDKLYDLLHGLLDELSEYPTYADDAHFLRRRVTDSFDALDQCLAHKDGMIPVALLSQYVLIVSQVEEMIGLARLE